MKLTLMKRFFDSVDESSWKTPIGDQIAVRWFKGDFDVRVLRASANFVCRVNAGEGDYYLRFNHSTERTVEYISAEIKYLQYIRGKGFNANRPVPSLGGQYVESVQTEMGVFHAVLFEAVPGDHIELDDLDMEGYGKWGRALGEYHNAGDGYRGDGIPSWRDHIAKIRGILPESEGVVLRELNSVEAALDALHSDDSNYGLIHYDFELDNIRWMDGVPGLMDFDDFVYLWYAADIIIGISELYDDKVDGIDLEDERFQVFLRGYRSTRPISDDDLTNVVLFLRFDTIYSYARIYWSTMEGPIEGEPQWTTDLRNKLQEHNAELIKTLTKQRFL